jgi:hypothetical protein
MLIVRRFSKVTTAQVLQCVDLTDEIGIAGHFHHLTATVQSYENIAQSNIIRVQLTNDISELASHPAELFGPSALSTSKRAFHS